MSTELHFYIDIDREEALRYYKGTARFVIVTASNGQRIQFPAEHIRPFINQKGIQGSFSIRFDSDNKLIGLSRLR